MTIRIQCRCGKILGSHDTDAGLRGFCPYCGRELRVPGAAPIQESVPEVHGGPISSKSVKKVESWFFAQQRRLWFLALLVLPAIGYLLIWQRELSRKESEHDDPQIPRQLGPAQGTGPDISELVKEPAPPEKPPVRVGKSGVRYDLSKFPDGEDWVFNVKAFGSAVGVTKVFGHDIDAKFADQEIRWTVTFERLDNNGILHFQEATDFLHANPPVNVWAQLIEEDLPRARELKKGEQVTIRGMISRASIQKTDDHPDGIVRIGPRLCIIEPEKKP